MQPSMVLRFYQLWTAICAVHPKASSSPNLSSGLSNCIVQFLSLFGPVEYDSLLPPGSGFDEHERQLQLDLQNATLVADSTSTPALNESQLVERLTNDKWYHVIILSTEELQETSSTDSTEQLIALFTSPHENQILWQNSPGCTSYSWRYGLVQLLPHILTSQTGDLSASFQHDAIRFSPHNDSSEDSSNVTIDLKRGTVGVERTGSPLLQFKLRSLKCYQMPGTAVRIHTVRSVHTPFRS